MSFQLSRQTGSFLAVLKISAVFLHIDKWINVRIMSFQMTNLVLNFEYLLLVSFLTVAEL